jgi:molybdopterin converting factor small subunit
LKIKVYPGLFCNEDVLDDKGFIYMEEGATLSDVYRLLKYPVPLRGLGLCMVNHKKAKMNTKLKDGDTVSFFTPLSGG